MRPNWRSSGVATAEAMVCGSAPGSPAPTPITGKSTLGSEATGRKLKARIPEGKGQSAEQGGHGRHHDRAEAQQACLKNGFLGWLVLDSFGLEREVDHHDGVFLYDADEQNNSDQRHHG